MNDTQLAYFLAVCDYGGYSAAASVMFTSRQLLSRSVNELEKELGGKLFYRKGRGVVPTPLGKRAAVIARSILDDVHHLKSLSNDCSLQDADRPPYSIAIADFGGRGELIDIQLLEGCLNESIPSRQFSLQLLPCEACVPALQVGTVDAIVAPGHCEADGIFSKSIGCRRPMLAVSSKLAPSANSEVSLARYKKSPFAIPESLNFFYTHATALCETLGFSPDWRHVDFDSASLASFILSGGVAFVGADNKQLLEASPNIRILPFKESDQLMLPLFFSESVANHSLQSMEIVSAISEFF